MVTYKKGDVFSALQENTVLVHGCNAMHVMGSGVAGIVRRDYPKAYYDYMACPQLKLGSVVFSCVDNVKSSWIANAITQQYYGSDGKRYASLEAIRDSLIKVKEFAQDMKVIMPEIGCGLGGLTTKEVFDIIEEVFNDDQECVVYSL